VFDTLKEEMWRLTPWEREFVESVYDQWSRGHTLSDLQLEKLEQVYMKV